MLPSLGWRRTEHGKPCDPECGAVSREHGPGPAGLGSGLGSGFMSHAGVSVRELASPASQVGSGRNEKSTHEAPSTLAWGALIVPTACLTPALQVAGSGGALHPVPHLTPSRQLGRAGPELPETLRLAWEEHRLSADTHPSWAQMSLSWGWWSPGWPP